MDLINAIVKDTELNEAKNVTDSTLTTIMGREAAYSGGDVTWDMVLELLVQVRPRPALHGRRKNGVRPVPHSGAAHADPVQYPRESPKVPDDRRLIHRFLPGRGSNGPRLFVCP